MTRDRKQAACVCKHSNSTSYLSLFCSVHVYIEQLGLPTDVVMSADCTLQVL